MILTQHHVERGKRLNIVPRPSLEASTPTLTRRFRLADDAGRARQLAEEVQLAKEACSREVAGALGAALHPCSATFHSGIVQAGSEGDLEEGDNHSADESSDNIKVHL